MMTRTAGGVMTHDRRSVDGPHGWRLHLLTPRREPCGLVGVSTPSRGASAN